MKLYLTIITILILSAFGFGQKQQKTEIKPNIDGKAIVYFYAPSAVTTIVKVSKPVFLDDKEIADVRPEKYFIAVIEPGKHVFRMKNKKIGGVEMNFDAGKNYYIRVNWATGNIVYPVGLTKVEEESGAYDIKQISPIENENIKEKGIVFTSL